MRRLPPGPTTNDSRDPFAACGVAVGDGLAGRRGGALSTAQRPTGDLKRHRRFCGSVQLRVKQVPPQLEPAPERRPRLRFDPCGLYCSVCPGRRNGGAAFDCCGSVSAGPPLRPPTGVAGDPVEAMPVCSLGRGPTLTSAASCCASCGWRARCTCEAGPRSPTPLCELARRSESAWTRTYPGESGSKAGRRCREAG